MIAFSQKPTLLGLNTFALDVPAPYWAEFDTAERLSEIVSQCRAQGLPWYVISGGSNIIMTGNFPGVYIHPTAPKIEIVEQCEQYVTAYATAGVVWDDMVAWAVEWGLGGIENLSYIPGMVGAAPVQNIGAYGSEVGDSVVWVEWFDTETMTLGRLSAEECRFGYRDSIFKNELRGRAIVTGLALRLSRTPVYKIRYGDLSDRVAQRGGTEGLAPQDALNNIRRAVIEVRREKLPDPAVAGNAGSFFKNPVISSAQASALRTRYPDMPSYCLEGDQEKIPAAWLIDRAGWKGYRLGVVGVHPNQPLVIVNYGGATANEILSLAGRVVADVECRFGIELSMEVNVV